MSVTFEQREADHLRMGEVGLQQFGEDWATFLQVIYLKEFPLFLSKNDVHFFLISYILKI